MQDTVERLLALVRAEVAPDVQEPAPVAMRTLIDDVVAWLAPMAQERGVRLSVGGEPFTVNGDAEQLREALNNVVANAILYNKPGGSVTISTRAIRRGRRASRSSTPASAFPPTRFRTSSIGSSASTRRDRARSAGRASGCRSRAPSSSRTAATSRARANQARARCSSFRSPH